MDQHTFTFDTGTKRSSSPYQEHSIHFSGTTFLKISHPSHDADLSSQNVIHFVRHVAMPTHTHLQNDTPDSVEHSLPEVTDNEGLWLSCSEGDASDQELLEEMQAALDRFKSCSTTTVSNNTYLALSFLPCPVFGDRFCLCCNHHQNNFIPMPLFIASLRSFSALEQQDIRGLAVMSRKKLLQYFSPIARALLCQKCTSNHRSGTVASRIDRITNPWVHELRRVIAMLDGRRHGISTPPAIIDLTRTVPSQHKQHPLACVICTDEITSRAKTCFQCGNAIHQSCFNKYRFCQDLDQTPAPTTQRDTLHLPCVFCRCIVLSVPRSRAGKARWDSAESERVLMDAAFARREQRLLDQRAVEEEHDLQQSHGDRAGEDVDEDADTVILGGDDVGY